MKRTRPRIPRKSPALYRDVTTWACTISDGRLTPLVITVIKIYTCRPSAIGDGARYSCNKVKTTVRDSEENKSAASKDFGDDRSFVLLSHPLSLPGGRVYRESLLETIPQVVNNPGARLAFQIYDVIFLCVTDPAGISTAIDRVYTHRACTQRFLRIALLNPNRNEDEIISVALRKSFRNNSGYTL